MLNQNFFESNCLPIMDYLNQYGSTCVIKLNWNMEIEDYNNFFTSITGFAEKPSGINFRDLIIPEDHSFLDILDGKQGYQAVNFTLLDTSGHMNSMAGYARKIEDGYLIFVERSWMNDTNVLNEVSKLNNEMANITRELNKKNIALAKANATINELLKTDSLTKIANRLYFIEYFNKVHAQALRHNINLALVMADLDDFKSVNDNYGHQVGDQTLIAFAKLLKENCRREDLPSRYGGEEFAILLVQSNAKQAAVHVERIRVAFEKIRINDLQFSVTASFGVASLQKDESIDSLIKRADDALYEAKRGGRNRVAISGLERQV